MEEAIEAANEIASEHLEIVTENPFEVMTKIRNAGAIFIGEYSSEPLGDYFAGPNHVLPTNGTAKFFSPLTVDDFVKKSSIVYYSREALEAVHEDIDPVCKGRAADCPRKFHCRYVLRKRADDTGGSRMATDSIHYPKYQRDTDCPFI